MTVVSIQIPAINKILSSYKIKAECRYYEKKRNIGCYKFQMNDGAKVRDLEKHAKELALGLRSKSLPRFSLVPEEGVIQMEVVEELPSKIDFYSRFYSLNKPDYFTPIPMYLGDNAEGEPIWMDMHKNPHLLVAGGTGSGKTTLLHTIIANGACLRNVDLFLLDPKNIEFEPYDSYAKNTVNPLSNIKVGYSYADAVEMFESLLHRMNENYAYIREWREPSNFFSLESCYLNHSLVVIDEWADLAMQDSGGRLHDLVCMLAQKGRAAGIHLVLATQRPSVDVIRGTIKANFPARIACRVSSRVDSKVVLDSQGAELLCGNGDALIKNNQFDMQRFQSAYVTSEDVIGYLENGK